MSRRLAQTIAVTVAGLAALAPAAQGAVNFEPARPFAAPAAEYTAAGDVNADAIPDVISASGSQISALIGNGDGTLRAARNTPSPGGFISALAAGDVTGDGRADVVITTPGPPAQVWVHRGIGDGTFAAAVPFTTGDNPQDVVLADLDGDSDLDMATADQGSDRASVFRNNGAGGFTAAPGVATVGQGPTDLAVADFNGDGRNDLAISAKDGPNEGISYAQGNGDGTFAPATNTPVTDPEHLAAADFNGDGRADLASARRDVGDVVIVARNDANTGFDAPVSESVGGGPGQPERLATADLDGDGDPDLAVPHTADRIVVLLGGPEADFSIGSQEPVADDGHEVGVADLNRDGNPDLAAAVSGSGGTHVAVLLAVPPIASTTPSLSYGAQRTGTESGPQTVVVRNNGAPRLRPRAVALGGANPDQFRIVSDTCTGANLAIGQECGVGVVFGPTGEGDRTATVSVASNGSGSPHSAQLIGTGDDKPGGPLVGTCANLQNGTAGPDLLTGTEEGDNLFGFGGDDILNGLGGNDCLVGGAGNDRLNGGEGNDTLDGGSGRDVADGGNGRDRLSGGAARDKLTGGRGNDTLNGGSGNDVLSGGAGNDRLSGSTGNDRIIGGSGKNTYSGGPGNDNITAANGRVERIDCGSGRDKVRADRRDRLKRCEIVRRTRR